VGSELGPEVALIPEVESRRKAVVRFLESDDPEPADIIHTVKFVRSTSSEGSAPNTDFAHFLDNVRKGVLNQRKSSINQLCGSRSTGLAYLDRSEWRTRKFQCPLDLEPV